MPGKKAEPPEFKGKLTTGDVDVWAYCNRGDPFPENPLRVRGEQNQYPAIWFKHGKAVCGRAWNDEGKVECSFSDGCKEVTGKFVQGQIQVLTYKGKFADNNFWYDWVLYPERFQSHLVPVKCGKSASIMIRTKKGENLVGNLNMDNDKATVAYNIIEIETLSGGKLADCSVLVRNHFPPNVSMENKWADCRTGDKAPPALHVAGGAALKGSGENYVALYYKNGTPTLGRAYKNTDGTIAASFACLGKEFTGNLGSIQVLQYTDTSELGFEYNWAPFEQAIVGTEWKMFKMGVNTPCIAVDDKENENLGYYSATTGMVSIGKDGKEVIIKDGKAINKFKVLCRRDTV